MVFLSLKIENYNKLFDNMIKMYLYVCGFQYIELDIYHSFLLITAKQASHELKQVCIHTCQQKICVPLLGWNRCRNGFFSNMHRKRHNVFVIVWFWIYKFRRGCNWTYWKYLGTFFSKWDLLVSILNLKRLKQVCI